MVVEARVSLAWHVAELFQPFVQMTVPDTAALLGAINVFLQLQAEFLLSALNVESRWYLHVDVAFNVCLWERENKIYLASVPVIKYRNY